MRERILVIINEVLEEAGASPLSELRDEQLLRDDVGLDSLMLAELTVRVEDEFAVDLFEDSVVKTVGEVVAKLQH